MTDDENRRDDINEQRGDEATNDETVNGEAQADASSEFEDVRDEGPMDQEMAPPEERELEGGEVLSAEETLSDAEDNAAVDDAELRREFEGGESVAPQDPPERDYAISSNMVRNLFIGSGIGAVVLITVILTLTSAIDQARYTPADETQYERTLTDATRDLTEYAQNENGRATIPIEQAMAITAERGLGEISAELGVQGVQQASQQNQQQAQQEQAQPEQAAQEQAQQGEQQAQSEQQGAQAQGEQAQQEQAQSDQQAQPAQQAAPEVMLAGEGVYTANCVSCHQANGQGIVGAFPTLVDHTPALHNADRAYLINLQLYGLQGQIQVAGQSYNGVMPAWQQLSDQEIADVLNYVLTEWGNNEDVQGFSPYTPEEIAAERNKGLSSSDVYDQRPTLQ